MTVKKIRRKMKKCAEVNTPTTAKGVGMRKLADLLCNFKDCDQKCAYIGNGEGFVFFLCEKHQREFKQTDMKILIDTETGKTEIVMAEKVH